MAITDLSTIYAVDIQHTAGTDLHLDQMTDVTLSPGLEEMIQHTDGDVDTTFVGLGGAFPTLSGSTTGIKTALDGLGIGGLEIDNGDGGAFSGFFHKLDDGGTRATGANHTKIGASKGIMIPTTLTATNDAFANLGIVTHFISTDGATAPITITTSQSLVTGSNTEANWVVGKATINGTDVAGVTNLSIDFGITLIGTDEQRSDGDVYPSFIAVQTRNPSISLTTRHVDVLDTFGWDGVAQSTTDSIFYLRKVDEGGKRVADGTEEHISFTIDEGRIGFDSAGGSGGGVNEVVLTMTPTYDGTNAVIVVDTTAAIA